MGKTASSRQPAIASYGSPPRSWGRRPVAARRDQPSVHPHARGDNAGQREPVYAATVHPHARGDNCQLRRRLHRSRFTPTLVGKTSSRLHRVRPAIGSPPRSWGQPSLHVRRSAYGSPPRSWGQRHADAPLTLTPVHPHARGDNAGACEARAYGSPPRSWGKPSRHVSTRRVRFTPTLVGKTRQRCRSVGCRAGSPPRSWGQRASESAGPRSAVHPHARGENSAVFALTARSRFTPTLVGTTAPRRGRAADGSPPRSWGRRFRRACSVPVHPHARGDDSTPMRKCGGTVHPHARGENRRCGYRGQTSLGSPPRSWGKPFDVMFTEG